MIPPAKVFISFYKKTIPFVNVQHSKVSEDSGLACRSGRCFCLLQRCPRDIRTLRTSCKLLKKFDQNFSLSKMHVFRGVGGLFHKAFLKGFSHTEKCVTLIQHRERTDSSNETKNARFRGCRGTVSQSVFERIFPHRKMYHSDTT